MIRLYNQHTNDWLNLVEGTSFSISATNQLCDLEKYDVGYSFDIELVNDENSRDASLYEYYASGGTQKMTFLGVEVDVPVTKLPKVVLYYDNLPLFIGRLSILSTTLSTIKCVYKAVPFGWCFKDFDMKPKLKDYFEQGVYNGTQLRSILDLDHFSIKGADRCSTLWYWPSLGCDIPNRSNNVLDPGNVFDTCCCIKNIENNKYVQYIAGSSGNDSAAQYFILSPIDELLEVMNIKTFFPDYNRLIAHPINVHYKRDIKVRYYITSIVPNIMTYKPKIDSEIWWINDSSHDWELLGECHDYGATTHAFGSSIRVCKGLNGLKLKNIEYPVNYDGSVFEQKGLLTMNTQNAYKSIDFGFETGHEFKDGEDITMILERTNIQTNTPAQYIDVIFEFEFNFSATDAIRFNKEYSFYTLYAGVPCMPYDIGLLDMDTTDFLNQLSLNHEYYKWLRNPSYFTPDNMFQVHGIEPKDLIRPPKVCKLKPEMIERITRAIKYDSPRTINIKVPTGFETICSKKLNNTLNDDKTIDMTMTGLGWCGYGLGKSDPALGSGVTTSGFNPPADLKRGTPPLIRDEHDDTFLGTDLKGCFGQVHKFTESHRGGVRITRWWWFLDGNSDFDYLEDYPDKTDKYEMTVVGGDGTDGYLMQPEIEFEGRSFIVESYKTSDFKKYELVCYEKTPWVKHADFQYAKYSIDTGSVTVGGQQDINRPSSSRNEIYLNGRPVNTRPATR